MCVYVISNKESILVAYVFYSFKYICLDKMSVYLPVFECVGNMICTHVLFYVCMYIYVQYVQ